MAETTKETVILDFQVEQGSAIQELEKTKKSIIQIKQEQKELTDAYKKGNVTLEEYVSETVRLEAILKKQQSTYNNTQKSVTGVKTKMDDLIKSNQNLNKSLEQGLNNATLFGTNIGGLKSSFEALANPVTATVAIVGALGAAYARSSIGAKDLEFASNQLSFATTILTDKFAGLFSSVEDGQGVVSKFVDGVITKFAGLDTAIISNLAANAKEELEQIDRDRIKANSEINDKLSENAELLTDIANKETKVNDKRLKAQQIQDNLNDIANTKLALLNREEDQERILGAATANKEDLERKINEIQSERSRVQKDQTKQTEKVQKQLNAIINGENQSLEIEKKKTAELKKQEDFREAEIQRNKRIADLEKQQQEGVFGIGGERVSEDLTGGDEAGAKKIDVRADKSLNAFIKREEKKRKELKKTTEDQKEYNQQQLEQTEENFTQLAGLFSQGSDARRLFALASIGADTASAIASLTANSEANPANSVTFGGAGVAQFAAGIIRILANIVAAKEFLGGEFAGGGDFVTTKPTYIKVGDNPGNRERVTVEPLSGRGKTTFNPRSGLVAFAGGGSMTFDPQRDVAALSAQQSLATSNAIKRMPKPVVGVKEIVRVMKSIEVKETISKQ